ncbi:hypothetical protein U1Q18_045356 [Sarracenia purpurea var. burkii]
MASLLNPYDSKLTNSLSNTLMLKNYLLDDLSSCSTNDFRSLRSQENIISQDQVENCFGDDGGVSVSFGGVDPHRQAASVPRQQSFCLLRNRATRRITVYREVSLGSS